MNLATGCIVEFSAKGSRPETGVILSAAGGSVRLLLLNGKETSIPDKKVLHVTSRAVTGVADRETCRQNLIKADQRRNEAEAGIDLAELHSLLVEEIRPYSLNELSGFLFAPDDDDAAAALLRRLSDDRLYFKSKVDTWHPLSPDELKTALEQQNRKEQVEREEAMLVEHLKKLGDRSSAGDFPVEHLNDLKNLVACGEEAKISKRLAAALDKAGLSDPRRLFQALVSAGILDADENLAIIKYRLPVEFSADLIAEADNLCLVDISSLSRSDLTGLKTWAIDTPGSKDRDDAFSFVRHTDGGCSLWVHVADPAELILPGSPLDKEAARRGSSVYMPDKRIHMLPTGISENFLSLSEGCERLALTFKLDFSAAGNLEHLQISESLIRIERALDYDTADGLLASEPWLAEAVKFAEVLKKQREAAGAMMFPRQPELSVKVVDGEILVERRNRDDLTQGMIAEFMIWANHAAAEWCRKHAVPCLYRVQEGEPVDMPPVEEFDPVAFFSVLRTLRKTVVNSVPGRHSSLGLASYTQITSPLRRYSDLLLHRQIKAAINGRPPVYSQSELDQTMMIADTAVIRADEIMRDRERYFLLKYLKQQQKSAELLYDGVVVDTSMTEVTFYVDFLCSFRHCRRPNFDVTPGQKVIVKVNQIDLFDGIIRFDLRQS